MIPVAKLQAVKHIIVHDSCPDGRASAMILRQLLPQAKISFIQYDEPEHNELVPEEHVLFCDFSPKTPEGWVERGAIVLDHHKTQRDIVEAFGELGVFGDEATEPGVCGATLAYREVWQQIMHLPAKVANHFPSSTGQIVREFAELAGVRDTWQTQDPRWRSACEQAGALMFWPVEDLLACTVQGWAQKLELGPVLFERNLEKARSAIKKGYRFTTKKGTRVIMFDGLRASSDAAEMLGSEVDFVVGFGFVTDRPKEGGQKPTVIYSTRSHTDFDCSAFAKAHGGGGHTKAAGFGDKTFNVETTLNPYALLRSLLDAWES